MRLNLFLFLLVFNFSQAQDLKNTDTDRCVTLLRKVLREQPEWIKVHAAEYLLWAGYPAGVRDVFLEEDKMHGNQSPYRIGIWRVLAQAAVSNDEKKVWTDKIKQAFLDSHGADRIHASETLAKLGISPFNDNPDLTRQTLDGEVRSLAIYTLWSVAFTSEQYLKDTKAKLLALAINPSEENLGKAIAAYAIRRLGNLSLPDWRKLAETALAEPANSTARINLLSCTFTTYPKGNAADQEQLDLIHTQLLTYKNAKQKGERSEMAMALDEMGDRDDLPVLLSMLNGEDPLGNAADDADVAAAAAYAILKINAR